MKLQVLFFASARERTGCAEHIVDVADGSTISAVFVRLVEQWPELEPLRPYLRFAVNEAFEEPDGFHLTDGDVLALIPPVSGGGEDVRLIEGPIDVGETEALVSHHSCGAVLSFKGIVRSKTGDHGVLRLEYEAYESMALSTFRKIVREATAEHPELRIAVRHRVGVLEVGDVAVIVAVGSPHRAAAFDACRLIIERMKEDVPIFKREARTDGSVWVGLGS
jgi:molybdopterin synthase catalytic subunit